MCTVVRSLRSRVVNPRIILIFYIVPDITHSPIKYSTMLYATSSEAIAKCDIDEPISSQLPLVLTLQKKCRHIAKKGRLAKKANRAKRARLNSRSLSTSVNNIRAKGGNRCTLQIETNAADRRMNGTMILNISNVDMIAG